MTELTFDPDLVSEVVISRVLTFLYTGVVELNRDNKCLEETIQISELLNLPELKVISQNALRGRKIVFSTSTVRNGTVAKKLFLDKVYIVSRRIHV